MLTIEEINDILDSYNEWLSYINIVGIDLEQTLDKKTKEYKLYLVVDVLNKKSLKKIMSRHKSRKSRDANFHHLKIPKQVEIPVFQKSIKSIVWLDIDVRANLIDEITEDVLIEPIDDTLSQPKKRPCPGGYSIRTKGVKTYGSICTSINYRGKYRLLSNNHVISKNGNVGKFTYQPRAIKTSNKFVKVSGFDEITYYKTPQRNPILNIKDIAWCDTKTSISSQKVKSIGKITGRRAPKINETILMFGGKTERLKTATIKSLTYRYRSEGPSGYSYWENGIKLDKNISQRGDSGSAYIAKSDKKLVCIHRAKHNGVSVGAPL